MVIADSGPLIALARLGLLGLLPRQFADVLVPQEVLTECTSDPGKPRAARISIALAEGLFKVVAVSGVDTFSTLHGVDTGEVAALILALERRCPALVDERRGRRVAADLGIPLVGTLGVLLHGRLTGQIGQLAPLLAALDEFGYRLSPHLVQAVLQRAGEA